MIDFSKYIGKHIILVTNYFDSPDDLFGIRNELSGIELFTVNNKYVCVRILTLDDLKDEDYLQWLNTMWPTEQSLTIFRKNLKKWIKRKSHQVKIP